ncbi:hypothetical protein EDD85DRAFT_939878 [Armillaria nabsnona]|nr:hypothetical protein EDD85DRAFT_939878 [Armillaria nabsnona]
MPDQFVMVPVAVPIAELTIIYTFGLRKGIQDERVDRVKHANDVTPRNANAFDRTQMQFIQTRAYERKCKCKRKLARERKRARVKRKILRAREEGRRDTLKDVIPNPGRVKSQAEAAASPSAKGTDLGHQAEIKERGWAIPVSSASCPFVASLGKTARPIYRPEEAVEAKGEKAYLAVDIGYLSVEDGEDEVERPLSPAFKEIGDHFGGLDLAMIPTMSSNELCYY